MLGILFYLLATAGGASLIVAWGGGMYIITAAHVMFMFLAILNAYLLMLPQTERAAKQVRLKSGRDR